MLAKYYNVSLDYIAGLTNNKRGLTASELSNTQRQLPSAVEKLSPEAKKDLISLLRTLITILQK